MLIDTGTGAGNLKEYVQGLTSKPLIVILTHGHSDHASGAAHFEQVYLNETDWDLVKYHASMEMKMDYVRFSNPDAYKELEEKDFCPVRTDGYLPLNDGDRFCLGGIDLEAVALPGHTKGMTCILNIQERSILFGDACNVAVFIWDKEATTIETYYKNLQRIKTDYEKRYDTVYLSHGALKIDKGILDGVMEVCQEVMDGKADEVPFQFMDYEGIKLAKAADASGNRADGGIGNLVYKPEKIFDKQNIF